MSASSRTRRAQPATAAEIAGLVEPGMWLDYGFGMAQPDAFDRALADRAADLRDVKVRTCVTLRPRAILEAGLPSEAIHVFNWHFTGYDRRQHDAKRCHYIPMNFGEAPDLYRRFVDPVDILVLKTCPEDESGLFNFGAAATYLHAIAERARLVVVETNPAMPYVFGPGNGLRRDEVDYVIEGDGAPAPEAPNPPPTDIDRAVAGFIVPELVDGACLQIGIGGMPNAVCSLLAESGLRDLGIHTEMMTDGIVDLYEAGLVNGARKQIDRDTMVFTFAAGSGRLYRAITRNPDAQCHPVDYTNLPQTIMRNDRAMAINNTTQIDLQGQAASESDGHRHISGTGGQLQFMRGAYASRDGKSFLCLSSTYEKRGEKKSRIVLNLTPGNVVTTPRTDVMYVVTEYGIANLKGKSVAERALALIGLAHPSFREGLEREAYENGLIPRGVSFGRRVPPPAVAAE